MWGRLRRRRLDLRRRDLALDFRLRDLVFARLFRRRRLDVLRRRRLERSRAAGAAAASAVSKSSSSTNCVKHDGNTQTCSIVFCRRNRKRHTHTHTVHGDSRLYNTATTWPVKLFRPKWSCMNSLPIFSLS